MTPAENLPLNTVPTFATAARLGNFSRAAEELSISQAAVSRQMRTLENALATRLFNRNRYSVSLTGHGKLLLASVSPFLENLSGAVEQIHREAGASREFVVFSDLLSTQATLLPSLSAFTNAQAAGTPVRLVTSDVPIENYPHAFDVGLQAGRWSESQFRVTTLRVDEIFPVCKPGMQELFTHRDGGIDLELATLLELDQPGRRWPGWSDYCEAAHIRYYSTRQILFDNTHALIEAAVRGQGIALGWKSVLKPYVESDQLAPLTRVSIVRRDGLCAYQPKGRSEHALTQQFLDWLRKI